MLKQKTYLDTAIRIGFWIICFIIGIIFLSIISGCGQNVPETPKTVGDKSYFPNVDGYSWTYNTSTTVTTSFNGSLTNISISQGTLKNYFNGTTSIEGVGTVQKFISYQMDFEPITQLINVSASTVESYGTLSSITREASNFLLFPFNTGMSWITTDNLQAIVLGEETVITPLGTFDCFKVKEPNDFYIWLSKNVGIVKMMQISTNAATSESFTITTTYISTAELVEKNFL